MAFRLVSGKPPIKIGDYHNMPQRFIDRHKNFIYNKSPRRPNYERKTFRYKTNAYYDQWRPWEIEFDRLNRMGVSTPRIFVEPIREWSFFRGDRVEVLVGPDKGKQGLISYIVKERNWVFVEGLNLERRIDMKNIMTAKEMPLLINREVKLVDPSDLEPTDYDWRYDDKGDRVRISTRTERILPIPSQAYATYDCKDRKTYKEGPKDTKMDLAKKVTFSPVAKTFEMDICDAMGIKDERVPHPLYWY